MSFLLSALTPQMTGTGIFSIIVIIGITFGIAAVVILVRRTRAARAAEQSRLEEFLQEDMNRDLRQYAASDCPICDTPYADASTACNRCGTIFAETPTLS